MKIEMAMMIAATLMLGCGGGGEGSADSGAGEAASEASAPASQMEFGEIDEQLAATGEGLMQSKGCTACHRVGGGRLVGPDLLGVTQRRTPEFIIAMIVNPDSMLVNNEDARQMLAEYFTPMANQNVTREDALALFEYFRLKDSQSNGE
jgi:mono/diheme cytochrome c family protein